MAKLVPITQQKELFSDNYFNQEQIEILKGTFCKDLTNDELKIFIMACTKTRLDPFMRQIYAVKRKRRQLDGSYKEEMTIQTGIDGYRLIAERTGKYSPGPEPTYLHTDQGHLMCATAHIKKQTDDGTWHPISASAYLDEFAQRSREGKLIGMWSNMPRTMLAKCAEAQALRKAFPAEMSGIYTEDEMQQAKNDSCAEINIPVEEVKTIPPVSTLEITHDQISDIQLNEMMEQLAKCGKDFTGSLWERIQKSHPNILFWKQLTPKVYKGVLTEINRFNKPKEVINA